MDRLSPLRPSFDLTCACCGFCLDVSHRFAEEKKKTLRSAYLVLLLLLLLLLTYSHLSCLHGLELGHLLWVHEAVLSHGHAAWHLVHLLRHQLLLSLLLDRLESLLLHLLGGNYRVGLQVSKAIGRRSNLEKGARLTVDRDRRLSEHLRVDLGIQMLHCVSIWATGHAPHESRWVYLSTWRRHAHLLGKVRRQATRLRAGLAWIMDHAGCHIVPRWHAWMLLLHARVWRKSLSGHHFDSRLSTTVDVGVRLSSPYYNGMRFLAGTQESMAMKRAGSSDKGLG